MLSMLSLNHVDETQDDKQAKILLELAPPRRLLHSKGAITVANWTTKEKIALSIRSSSTPTVSLLVATPENMNDG